MGLTDEEIVARLPRIVIDHDTKDLYGGWLQRRLMLRRCRDCARWHHPPRPRCPQCWSESVESAEVTGTGTVYLLMRLRQGPEFEGVDYSEGWPVATVELDEQRGLRYTSALIGPDARHVSIGDRVELAWIERAGEPYPVFLRSERG
jgi:uncharacterized OB-fold protein